MGVAHTSSSVEAHALRAIFLQHRAESQFVRLGVLGHARLFESRAHCRLHEMNADRFAMNSNNMFSDSHGVS